jgi:GtrA-like protein
MKAKLPSRHAACAGVVGQTVRYGIVVACGYLLAIAFYAGELEVGVSAYPAFGVVFVLNGLFNFALLRAWAFSPSGRSVGSDFGRFCVVAAASFVVNYASFAVLYSALGLHATTAQRLAILIAAPVTFLANRLWSFRARASSRETSSVGATAAGLDVLSSTRGQWRR